MKVRDLFSHQEEGVLTLDGERIVLTSAAIFGTLRKDLTENLGIERVKGFLMRYGWNLGAADAEKALEHPFHSLEEVLKQGAQLHMLKGYTNAKTTSIDIERLTDGRIQSVQVEGIWRDSYEAEEYLRVFGQANESVCHTLIGYASGFYSTVSNQTIIFKEVTCQGAGHSECRYIGKVAAAWGEEAEEAQQHYKNNVIIKELEKTYEQLLEERNNLTEAAVIHEKLAEEVMAGNDLNSIARVMFDATATPMIIEDANFTAIASAGLTRDELVAIETVMQQYVVDQQHSSWKHTVKRTIGQHLRVTTPIILQSKVFGYCSFIYKCFTKVPRGIDQMILERAATVCSLHVLNEKTAFETEERIKGYFLDQILAGQLTSTKEIVKRASYYQLDLRLPYSIVVLQYRSIEAESYLNEEVMSQVAHYFKGKRPGLLIGRNKGDLVLLIQTSLTIAEGGIKKLCEQFLRHMKTIAPNKPIRLGISTESSDITQIRKCFEEAAAALKIGKRTRSIISFDSLGVTGILLQTQNKEAILQKASHTLEPIFSKDPEEKLELLKTLYIFLINGGNLEQTTEELAISMSGLRYRIEKIEKLLEKNLRDPETSYELTFILKALIVAGELNI